MTSRPRRLKWAAALLAAQAILIELSVLAGLIVLLALGMPELDITNRVDIFALPYLNANLYLMMGMSGIFGALRLTGAIGLWRGRMWGLALSLINSAVTMVLMIFMLPAGILDGLLTGIALVLMLTAWLGDRRIHEDRPSRDNR